MVDIIRFYKLNEIPQQFKANALYIIKITDNYYKVIITDNDGKSYELVSENGNKVDGFHIHEWKTAKGLIIPFYKYPFSNGDWDTDVYRLINIVKITNVPTMVIVNPDSGVGEYVDIVYKRFINLLKGAGIVVLGYVRNKYGHRNLQEILNEISIWKEYYPKVDGIFVDEVEYIINLERHKRIYEECKKENFNIVVGNPGVPPFEYRFDDLNYDLLLVDENIGLNLLQRHPTFEGNWENSYREKNRNRFCGIAHSTPELTLEDFLNYSKYFSYVYITDNSPPNPYNGLPTYFEKLVGFAISGNIYHGMQLAELI